MTEDFELEPNFVCENYLCLSHDVPDNEEYMVLRFLHPRGFIVTKGCPRLNDFVERHHCLELGRSDNLICLIGDGIF